MEYFTSLSSPISTASLLSVSRCTILERVLVRNLRGVLRNGGRQYLLQCVEDSIAQEFQPFVVDGTSFFGAHGDGFMQQSLLIDLDVTWKEAENSVKTKIRLSILAEQEPYFIYLVT